MAPYNNTWIDARLLENELNRLYNQGLKNGQHPDSAMKFAWYQVKHALRDATEAWMDHIFNCQQEEAKDEHYRKTREVDTE